MAQTSTKNEAYVIAKKLLEEKKLNPAILSSVSSEGDEYVNDLVAAALHRLAPVHAMLRPYENDVVKLEGFELEGTIDAIDEVYNMLDAAFHLHSELS